MAIKLMYITNRPEIALIAESAGVDRIFVDMEYIGKAERQRGMDTVKSRHTVEDVARIKKAVSRAEVMVRVNPIHEASESYTSSKEEIDAVIASGADVIMLPYFKTADEVRAFVQLVGGRARTLPLLETREAAEAVDEILAIDGIDEIFVGLNDLSISYGKKFLFEVLADGTVDRLCLKFRERGIPFGFGGLASLDGGAVPGRMVLKEHYRLGSSCVILSRAFCNTDKVTGLDEVRSIFESGVKGIREFELLCREHADFFCQNRTELISRVNAVVEGIV